jgi:hypothetical protein
MTLGQAVHYKHRRRSQLPPRRPPQLLLILAELSPSWSMDNMGSLRCLGEIVSVGVKDGSSRVILFQQGV